MGVGVPRTVRPYTVPLGSSAEPLSDPPPGEHQDDIHRVNLTSWKMYVLELPEAGVVFSQSGTSTGTSSE